MNYIFIGLLSWVMLSICYVFISIYDESDPTNKIEKIIDVIFATPFLIIFNILNFFDK